ncbi:uncharacterized protein LOC111001189 [Pieris rapae]|uniref:uncharacterized protein LOC111001189 n=1 Tax=Pieris rapae TaxID=64459 RepID=UPI001E27A40B|nr:uncharacterized protein LOC111001189 [Pieris rapae]
MSTDIIELDSSDDEMEPVPKKKKVIPNAMVKIPSHTKLPGVTIKPVKSKKVIPIFGVKKTVPIPRISINPLHAKHGNSRNSLLKANLKKFSTASESFPIITNVSSCNTMGSKLLRKLPSSITVKKATASRTVSIPIQKAKLAQEIVLPAEIHDKPILLAKPLPQWYKKPEDLESETHLQVKEMNEIDLISMEEKNNIEPKKLIEITIDDSPVKLPTIKQTEDVAIMIDDSPAKAASSMKHDLKQQKEKQSKKMLNYDNIKIVKDITGMIEVEVDAIDVDQLSNEPSGSQSNKQTDKSQVSEKQRVKKPANEDGEFNPIYQKFIDTCLHIENSNDMQYIVEKKIKSYYRQCPKEYVDSEEFLDLVSGKIIAIEASPNKMYLYIRDVVNQLNIQRKMVKPGTSSKEETSAEYPGIDVSECDTKHQRHIKKLEKTLTKLHRAIQKMEEQDVDFDEEDDSIYLLTERYKERFLRVHAKFCQLTQTKMPSEPYIKLETEAGRPKGPAARLEKWINKKVPIGKPLPFPDFHDVLRCVREANAEDKLGWSEMEILEEARELFISCGKKLKRRRQENEWRIAASRLPVNEDPAENNIELKKKLEENKLLAKRNETYILNKYVDRQNLLNLEPEVIGDKEAEESPLESDEEDDNESNALPIKKKNKITMEEPNIEANTSVLDPSNKDESNLLKKMYSESDSDSPINLTDSDNEPNSPKVINSDVISIEDSTYSESENCEDRPDESNMYPVQMDIEISEDSIHRDDESNDKEYLTVHITEDIQELLTSKGEIEKKMSLVSSKESSNKVDEINNDVIEIINDNSNHGTERNVTVEINNVEPVSTDKPIGKLYSYDTETMVQNTDKLNYAQVKVKQTQKCEESITPESMIRQVKDDSNNVNVTSTNQLIGKEKCNTEMKKTDIDMDVEMGANDVATTDKPFNIAKNNVEVELTKENIDIEINDADIIPKSSKALQIETVKITNIETKEGISLDTEKSNLKLERPSRHTDLEITESDTRTDRDREIVDEDNIEMTIEHKDVNMKEKDIILTSHQVDKEINEKFTDKSVHAEKDYTTEIEKTDLGTDVNVLKNFDDAASDNTVDLDKMNCNGDVDMGNIQSDVPLNKEKNDLTGTVVKSNVETTLLKDCSDVELNSTETEKRYNYTNDPTIKADNILSNDENSTIISDICTKIIENVENVTNIDHDHKNVTSNVVDSLNDYTINAVEVPMNTEKDQRDNFNKKESEAVPKPIDDCGNLENNILTVENCSQRITEVNDTIDKKHDNPKILEAISDFNYLGSEVVPKPIDDCGNLENNILTVENCSQRITEVNDTIDKKHDNPKILEAISDFNYLGSEVVPKPIDDCGNLENNILTVENYSKHITEVNNTIAKNHDNSKTLEAISDN